MHVLIISSLVQQCHAPGLVAVTKFKITKINFEGLFGFYTKITHQTVYVSTVATRVSIVKQICLATTYHNNVMLNLFYLWAYKSAGKGHKSLMLKLISSQIT